MNAELHGIPWKEGNSVKNSKVKTNKNLVSYLGYLLTCVFEEGHVNFLDIDNRSNQVVT